MCCSLYSSFPQALQKRRRIQKKEDEEGPQLDLHDPADEQLPVEEQAFKIASRYLDKFAESGSVMEIDARGYLQRLFDNVFAPEFFHC